MYDEETWVPAYDNPQNPRDPGNWVKFTVEAVKNQKKTDLAGRPIFDNKVFVHIKGPGMEKSVPAYEIDPPNPETGFHGNEYYRRYQKPYEAFKSNGMEGISGTPLTELPFLSKAEIAEIRASRIHSAEQLAALNENTLVNMGPGFRSYHDKAKLYLKKAEDMAPLTAMQAQIDALKEQLAAEKLDKQNLAAAAAAVAAQPKREKLKLGGQGEAA